MKRVSVRQSPIHGKGVFALQALSAGERIFEYKGLVTTWREATRACAQRTDAGHTFLFGLSDGRVIDGGRGGNGARWLNHACMANCEAIEKSGRVYIDALRDIQPGEELFIDYALEIPPKAHDDATREYTCRCGSRRCRGTMLGPIQVRRSDRTRHRI
ncbi:SET domain-containing protein [Paraburkholderia sp. CNPSo 3281]|uniref:SET domain-containing protein n=1 Tax=Paraburkholderia sp. CNPSo 3281 TaxID=2940933 RepID=UPI0020B7AA90|nr:SET domain-containing protein-lysine N-methyltransferase [Paraburkholderia sp. CNPSo 3281]MCP3716430.1 SET domain-containing protein-lysine N-methyltransferase [Paraburkholderia sp. CNPSo 3281]